MAGTIGWRGTGLGCGKYAELGCGGLSAVLEKTALGKSSFLVNVSERCAIPSMLLIQL